MGYVIFVAFMSVGITSALRHKIKHRVFYVVHHIVFAAYLLTILHTIDNVERQKGGRSQAFKWFSASLLLYISDRASMYLSHRYHTHVVTAYTIDSEVDDHRLIILKAKKPEVRSLWHSISKIRRLYTCHDVWYWNRFRALYICFGRPCEPMPSPRPCSL